MNTAVEQLQQVFEPAGDTARAQAMSSYMRGQFDFVGLASPRRRALQAPVWKAFPDPTSDEIVALVDGCWELPSREYQYAALDYLSRHAWRLDTSAIVDLERWIVTTSWWDTVDVLCRHGAGVLVRANLALGPVMDRWLRSGNVWLIRSAILHQERWGTAMDVDWVFAACALQGEHHDFFVRKAIGWVLRTYAHCGPTEADEVRSFIGDHADRLSGLSKREAMMRVFH